MAVHAPVRVCLILPFTNALSTAWNFSALIFLATTRSFTYARGRFVWRLSHSRMYWPSAFWLAIDLRRSASRAASI